MNKEKMPVIFVGHGSPMNAIEDNRFSIEWKKIFENRVKPRAILAISAHWYIDGTYIQSAVEPKQIYDMYGFPEELYKVKYKVKGDQSLTEAIKELLKDKVAINNEWGIDHGTWSVLVHMFPKADIPVVQLSINRRLSLEEHWNLAKTLAPLREDGILILASGNILHNLRKVQWNIDHMTEEGKEFDDYVHDLIMSKNYMDILKIESHPLFKYAVPTPDHFIPLIYALANINDEDSITSFNRDGSLGTISMTSYIGENK